MPIAREQAERAFYAMFVQRSSGIDDRVFRSVISKMLVEAYKDGFLAADDQRQTEERSDTA